MCNQNPHTYGVSSCFDFSAKDDRIRVGACRLLPPQLTVASTIKFSTFLDYMWESPSGAWITFEHKCIICSRCDSNLVGIRAVTTLRKKLNTYIKTIPLILRSIYVSVI